MLDRIENKLIDNLKSIDILSISDLFDCKIGDVGDIINGYFAKRTSFKGDINLSGIGTVTSLGKIKRIDGDLVCVYGGLTSLGDLRIVNGDITIRWTPLVSTGKLLYCNNLTINSDHFKEIRKLSEVKGDVELSNTELEGLNKLNLVGGYLKLKKNSKLASMGNLVGVYGDVIIDSCDKLETLGSLEHIGGCLDVRNAKLQSFGALNDLGGFAIALKSRVKNLYESDLKIVNLTPLTSIFPDMQKIMHLEVPKIDKLTNFGMIVIDDGDNSESTIYSI